MSNKICSADIESLFSEYLVAGEYVICCQATAENASLTDRGVIVPPKKTAISKTELNLMLWDWFLSSFP